MRKHALCIAQCHPSHANTSARHAIQVLSLRQQMLAVALLVLLARCARADQYCTTGAPVQQIAINTNNAAGSVTFGEFVHI